MTEETQAPVVDTPAPEATFETTAIPETFAESAIGKYATVGDLAKGYEEAQKLIGAKGILPPKEGDAADLERYYKDLGRPDKAEAYEFGKIEGLHPNLEMKPEDMAGFKDLMHKHGITSKQADGIYQDYFGLLSSAMKRNDEASGVSKHAAETTLRTEWGAEYDKNLAQVGRLVDKFGGADGKDAFGDLGNNPAVLKTLANISKNFSEDGYIKGDKVIDADKKTAQLDIDKIMMNREHPYHSKIAGHDEAVAEVKRLYGIVYPEMEV